MQFQLCLVQFVCFEVLINTLGGVSQRLLDVISAIEVIKLYVDYKSLIKPNPAYMVRWVSLLYAVYLRDILQILKTH